MNDRTDAPALPEPPIVDVSVDLTPARAEVYQIGRWEYRIRVYTKDGWLIRTDERYGRRRAERRADELLAAGPPPLPGPVYVATTPESR